MKPFNIKLSEEHRVALERQRKLLGLKSEADVVRYWADNGGNLLDHLRKVEGLAVWQAGQLNHDIPVTPDAFALALTRGEMREADAIYAAVKNMGVIGEGDTVTPLQPTPKTVARKGQTGDNAGEKTAFFQDVGNAERIVRGDVRVDPKSMIERGPMTPKTLTPGRDNPKPGKGMK